MRLTISAFFYLSIIFALPTFGQNEKEDSLLLKLSQSKQDTTCIDLFHDLAENCFFSDPQKAIEYCLQAKVIAEKINDLSRRSETYGWLGYLYENLGQIELALEYYNLGLEIEKKNGDNNLLAGFYNNIGIIYYYQGQHDDALVYYQNALSLYRKIGMTYGLGSTYSNIASYYQITGDIELARTYYDSSLIVNQQMGDPQGIAYSLVYLGILEMDAGKFDEAIVNFERSIELEESFNDKKGIAYSCNRLGLIYLKQNNLNKALEYGNRSMTLAQELGYPEDIKNAADLLTQIYEKQNKGMEALQMYRLYIDMRDSIDNLNVMRATVQNQAKFEYDKKAAEDSVAFSKESEIQHAAFLKQKAELKAKRNLLVLVFGGLALVIVFALFMVNRFRVTSRQKRIIEIKEHQTQKQNEIIKQQKHLVEEKHKEITDSINYAERIQRSFLATKKFLDKNLNRNSTDDYFVLFLPKDVVSGDFYWAHKLKNENFVVVTADSTGHGVPGSIMSILNISALEKSVESGITEPDEILNDARRSIINRLKRDGSLEGGKDGMDASLLCFDFQNWKLTYAAANNPVWLVRDGMLHVYEHDKMPVGKHEKDLVPFSQNQIDLQSGDLIYALTDGFGDQFGGSKGKKFMNKQLKELIVSNANQPMSIQRDLLLQSFNEWKKSNQKGISEFEQVDDVCVIGIKI